MVNEMTPRAVSKLLCSYFGSGERRALTNREAKPIRYYYIKTNGGKNTSEDSIIVVIVIT